jgi:hypothetical protein
MMFASESTATFNACLGSIGSRGAPCRTARRTLSAYTAVVVAKLREFAPYAAMELVLPGGSLMALGLWLYRRQRKISLLPRTAGSERIRYDSIDVPLEHLLEGRRVSGGKDEHKINR